MKLHIRWAIRRDIPDICRIENATCGLWVGSWGEGDFLRHLRQRNCVAMVAETDTRFNEEIVGFALYYLHRDHLDVRKLSVSPLWENHGVGTALVRKMADKLMGHRRAYLNLPVGGKGVPVSPWPCRFDPSLMSGTVRAMVGEGQTPHLGVLADALEDVDCANRVLLDTFRRGGRFAQAVYEVWRMTIPCHMLEVSSC